ALGAPGKRTLTEALPTIGHVLKHVQRSDRDPRAAGPPAPAPRSPGAPIAQEHRRQMELAFGHDFSGVTVHESPEAEAAGAHAFTRGEQIHFAPGRYTPDTPSGQELLGH